MATWKKSQITYIVCSNRNLPQVTIDSYRLGFKLCFVFMRYTCVLDYYDLKNGKGRTIKKYIDTKIQSPLVTRSNNYYYYNYFSSALKIFVSWWNKECPYLTTTVNFFLPCSTGFLNSSQISFNFEMWCLAN